MWVINCLREDLSEDEKASLHYNLQVFVCPEGQWARGQIEEGWDQQAVMLLLSNVSTPMILILKARDPLSF